MNVTLRQAVARLINWNVDRLAAHITTMLGCWRSKPDRAILFEAQVWAVA